MALRDLAATISPSWLQGANGARYMYLAPVLMDAQVDRVEQGVRLKMPQKCDPTALPYIGRDRTIVRGVSESDESFALRCKTAPYDWHFAGVAGSGIMQALRGYLSPAAPMIRVVWAANNTNRPTQWAWLPDGSARGDTPTSISTMGTSPYWCTWYWDAIDNRRRCWVIIYVNATGAPWVTTGTIYGTARTYGDGHLYGLGGITAAQVQTIRALCKTWKAAHARVENIIVCFSSTSLDPLYSGSLPGANATLPNGLWANYGKASGSLYTQARFSTSRYIEGVG